MEEKKRKADWTEEEDKILVETVLTFIREGKTQTQAFEETALILDRTKPACDFRWNKTLRKKYNFHKSSPSRKLNEIQSHLNQAMTTYITLAESYEKLQLDYQQLLLENKKLKAWLSNGTELL